MGRLRYIGGSVETLSTGMSQGQIPCKNQATQGWLMVDEISWSFSCWNVSKYSGDQQNGTLF